jgi:hypothetical protein
MLTICRPPIREVARPLGTWRGSDLGPGVGGGLSGDLVGFSWGWRFYSVAKLVALLAVFGGVLFYLFLSLMG